MKCRVCEQLGFALEARNASASLANSSGNALAWIPKLDWFIRLNRLDGVDL